MKKLIIALLLLTTLEVSSQVYTSASFDPNIAVGNSMLNEAGLNYKLAFGYTWNRLTVFKQFEQYKAIDFKKWSANIEYRVFKYNKLESTFNLGYGCIYRDFNEYNSYNVGGKIAYNIGKFSPFIEYSIDGRPELPGDNRNHLRNKGKFQNVRSIYLGVSYRFKLKKI